MNAMTTGTLPMSGAQGNADAAAVADTVCDANSPRGVAPYSGDFFSIGAIMQCETCHGEVVEGEVLAFEHSTRVLALRIGNGSKAEIQLLNLNYVSRVNELRPAAADSAPTLPSVNPQKSKMRLEQAQNTKKQMIAPKGVNPAGMRLFNAIHKTLERVRWDHNDLSIVVLDSIVITPPYTTENARLKNTNQPPDAKNERSLTHVRKIIDKHVSDEQRRSTSVDSTPSNAGAKQQPNRASSGSREQSTSPDNVK